MNDKTPSNYDSKPVLVFGTTIGKSASNFLRGQLHWFEAQGWSVVLVTDTDGVGSVAAEREGVRFEGVKMARAMAPFSDVRSLLRWIQVLHRLKPRAVNVGTPKAGLLGGLAAWILRVPRRVYTVHGLRLEGARGLMYAVLWLMEKIATSCATDVVVVSASLGTRMREHRLLPKHNSWLIGKGSCNGVDTDAISKHVNLARVRGLRDELKIPGDACVVGFIGRITADKGIETLLSAIRQLEPLDPWFLIIGDVEDARLAHRISVTPANVTQLGWTDDLWSYWSVIDILCLPTLREGFPTVVLEAAAAGIPTVTTRATGAVDSVEDCVSGYLIDVGDDRALAERLTELVNNRTLRKSMGAAARTAVSKDFVPQATWAGMAAIIDGQTSRSNSVREVGIRKPMRPHVPERPGEKT